MCVSERDRYRYRERERVRDVWKVQLMRTHKAIKFAQKQMGLSIDGKCPAPPLPPTHTHTHLFTTLASCRCVNISFKFA